jgi:hypothetical protein
MNNFKKHLLARFLPFALLVALVSSIAACTVPSWVNTVESIAQTAIPIAAQIVAIADPALGPYVIKASDLLTALIAALDTYKANLKAKAGAGQEATDIQAIQAASAALQSNESSIMTALKASPKQDATVSAVVSILNAAINAIASYIPQPSTGNMAARSTPSTLTADEIKKQFDQAIAGDKRFHPIK